MTTGQRIKAARKNAGMTQAELADKLCIPYQSVSQWERNTRNPKIETLNRIAAALGVEALELVPEEKQSDHFSSERYVRESMDKGAPYVPEWSGPPPTAENRRAHLLALYDHVLSVGGQKVVLEAIEIIAGNPVYQREDWRPPAVALKSPPKKIPPRSQTRQKRSQRANNSPPAK